MAINATANTTYVDWYAQQLAAHRADPNAAFNYLINDPSRRQPYAENMKAAFDYAETHWQEDARSYFNLTNTFGTEMKEVLNNYDWDTIDPAFKQILKDNILRSDRLHDTIMAAHPELDPHYVPR